MDGALWSQIVDIFHAALERPEQQRTAFIAAACNGNAEIQREVVAMLDEDRRGVSRLQRGIIETAEEVFRESHTAPAYSPPERIGPYERREFLGRGGMGAVWKAVRVDTGQPMAIKFLLPLGESSSFMRERFAHEISMLARLRHPHIVSFHDAGTLQDGTPWFVMDFVEEYLRGMRFTTYCRVHRRTIDERLRLFRTTCEAVLYAHRQGIIHRDLKPSNILIAKDGTPRVVDFGIARQLLDMRSPDDFTGPSLRMMSLDYAAPEWRNSGQLGVYTDVYSLGVILYEVFCGRHPYRTTSPDSGLSANDKLNLPPKPSSAVAENGTDGVDMRLSRSAWKDLDKLCLTALHPDPQQRYASVESLVRDIDHYLSNEPLDAQPSLLAYRVRKFVRRNRRRVLLAAATAALVLSMAVLFTWRLAKERNLALAEAERVGHIQAFMTDLLQGGDQDAGPAANLRVTTMIDRGIKQADLLSEEPTVQADLYETLGVMSQKLGHLDQAEMLLEKSLKDWQSLNNQDRTAIAQCQLALAAVWSDQGKTKQAVTLARQSLDEIMHLPAGNRLLTGKAELALGTALIAAGEQKQAIGILQQATATIQATEGARSADLARALGTLADAQVYSANYDAADSLNRRALAVDQAVYGKHQPHVADDLGNLAQSLEVGGYYAQAEPLERQALDIMEEWYGPDHPETARKLTTLASTLYYEGKDKEAKDLLQHALAIQERVYGPQHPRVAYVLNVMGSVDLDGKAFPAAENDFSRVADIYRQAYGDGDYRVAVALGNLASVYQAEGRYPKCESLLLEVVSRFTRAVGADNVNTGMAQVRLGRTLLHEKKYSASAAHSLAGYQVLVHHLNPDSAWLSGARHDLAIDYDALGERQKAKQFRAGPARAKPPAEAAKASR